MTTFDVVYVMIGVMKFIRQEDVRNVGHLSRYGRPLKRQVLLKLRKKLETFL